MEKPSVKCALLATMIAKHKWGTPISEEGLLNLSAIDGDYPTAREVYAANKIGRPDCHERDSPPHQTTDPAVSRGRPHTATERRPLLTPR